MSAVGEKVTAMRRRFGRDDRDEDEQPALPRLVRAALENLREVAAKQIAGNADAETRIVEVLARAAQEMRKN